MLIPLTNSSLMAEIDAADYYSEYAISHQTTGTSIKLRPCDVNWHMHQDGYVIARKMVGGTRYRFFMHNLILGKRSGFVIDHISQNKLDNKRANLHFVTVSENNYNKKSRAGTSSTYKGVYLSKQINKYVAKIGVQGRYSNLGAFTNEVDAALAYDAALRRVYPNAPKEAFNF